MATLYTSSQRETEARLLLYKQVHNLRGALLDLLTLVRHSEDPIPAVADIALSPIDQMKQQIRKIEHHDLIIARARAVLDDAKDAESLTGPQGSENG